MESKVNMTIELTENLEIFNYCASLMSKSDPWITLELDYELCKQAFTGLFDDGPWRDDGLILFDRPW